MTDCNLILVRPMQRTALILAAYIILSLNALAVAEPAAGRGAIELQIRQSIEDWRTAANRGDDAGTSKIWAPGVKGWFPSAAEFKNAAAFRRQRGREVVSQHLRCHDQ